MASPLRYLKYDCFKYILLLVGWLLIAPPAAPVLFSPDEKSQIIPPLTSMYSNAQQGFSAYRQTLLHMGIQWPEWRMYSPADATFYQTLLAEPETNHTMREYLRMGKVFANIGQQGKPSAHEPEDLTSRLFHLLKQMDCQHEHAHSIKACTSDAVIKELKLHTEYPLPYEQVVENYQKIFSSIASIQGVSPEVMLGINNAALRLKKSVANHSWLDRVRFFSPFYEQFFSLASIHQLKPTQVNVLSGDAGLSTLSVPLIFRHPPPDKNAFDIMQCELPLSSVGGTIAQQIESFITMLSEPLDNQAYMHMVRDQDFLLHVKSFSGGGVDEVFWVGIRKDRLYVSVCPYDGFFLLYEIPKYQQKAFLAKLMGVVIFPLMNIENKPLFQLQAIFVNQHTTCFNQYCLIEPVPPKISLWKTLGKALCCLPCLLCHSSRMDGDSISQGYYRSNSEQAVTCCYQQ